MIQAARPAIVALVSSQRFATHSLAGGAPIPALDMYEHSYHMDYGAKAAAYVDAFMQNLNWANVARLYEAAAKASHVHR